MKETKLQVVKNQLRVVEPTRVKLSVLNKAPYNPRDITPENFRALKASLRENGLVQNLVVQKRSAQYGPLVIIAGHQRCDAIHEICTDEGWEAPEYVYATILDIDDKVAKRLNVTLNSDGVEGEFNPYKLGTIFEEIAPTMTSDEILSTGFAVDRIDELRELAREDAKPEEKEEIGAFAKSITLSVHFDTVEQRDRAKEKLAQIANEQGVKPGAILLKAISSMAALKKSASSRGRKLA